MGSLRSLRRQQSEPVIGVPSSDMELLRAVQYNQDKQARALLERGANPNALVKNITVLGIAIFYKRINLVRLLVHYGANVGFINDSGRTLLHVAAAFAGLKAACEISRFLLDHSINVNAVDIWGCTPLMYAIIRRNVELTKLLLKRGADATLRNSYGERALDLLRRGKGSAALRKLLEPVS